MVGLLRRKYAEAREVAPEIAAIDRRQTIALHLCVSGDEKIRDQMLAGSARLTIAVKGLPGEVGGIR